MPAVPIPITSQPGIQRDGTRFAAQSYVDGQWCRFQRGKPRKIGGFQMLTTIPEPARGSNLMTANGTHYSYYGTMSHFEQVESDQNETYLGAFDRVPAAFVINPATMWQVDFLYLTSNTSLNVIAHPGLNLTNIDNTNATNIFSGPAFATTALVDSGISGFTGGIVVLGPYLFAYGSAGSIAWGLPNSLTFTGAGSGAQNVTGQKIIKGMELRGTGGGPGGLFWSLDSLIRCTYVGTPNYFAFDTLTSDISVMSSRSIVEFAGIYYWAGVGRFFQFNGVAQELPNTMNVNYFFNNIQIANRQKVFAFVVPQYGEIWWCYPQGNATECNAAIIYNVREGYWYDTMLPTTGRSDGLTCVVHNDVFAVDSAYNSVYNGYPVWIHEMGTDQVLGTQVSAIDSWFETNEITMLTQAQAQDKSLRVARVEPDFVQTGTMTMYVNGRANARAPIEPTTTQTIVDPTLITDSQQQVTMLKDVRRLMSFRFESNVAGGNYQMGQPLAFVEPADGRVLG